MLVCFVLNEFVFFAQIVVLTLAIQLSCRLGWASVLVCLCIQVVLANTMVLKKIMLFGFDVTASDSYAVGSMLCINILREYEGSKATQLAMATSWLWMVVSAALFYLHISFIPSATDSVSDAYTLLLSPIISLIMQSFLIIMLVQCVDYLLFACIRRRFLTWSFTTRSLISLLITQAIDTALFTCALGMHVSLAFWQVFAWSYLIKVLVVLAMSTGVFRYQISTEGNANVVAV